MNELREALPFLLPLIALQLILAVIAFVHVQRHRNYRYGNRVIWSIVVLLVQFIGPILYFATARGED